jgi:hypothetical protein
VACWVRQDASDDLFAAMPHNLRRGRVGEIGGPFTLVSETGETVTDADVITMPTLLYFGYTFCPDVCPLDTVRNAEAVDILEQQGIMVQPVMISVDPSATRPRSWTISPRTCIPHAGPDRHAGTDRRGGAGLPGLLPHQSRRR